MSKRTRYTTASQLAEYVYCRRAWWLHYIQGFKPRNRSALSKGSAGHSRHGLRVTVAGWLVNAGRLLIVLGIVLIVLLLALG